MKKLFGFIFLIASLTLLSLGSFSITGNVVANYFPSKLFSFHLIGLIFLLVSILIFTSKKSLDAIIIPTGDEQTDIERPQTASKRKADDCYVISGYVDKRRPIKYQQSATIYRELRKLGIKPSHIKIEGKSHDSLENALYSLEKLKGMKEIGIVSYPWHLKRYKEIIEEAQKEGIITKNIKIEYIPTKETAKEKVYGFLGNIKEKYRLRHGIKEAQKHRTGWFGNLIKKIIE